MSPTVTCKAGIVPTILLHFLRLGNCSMHCPTFRHLTARDGGNARRLLGAIFVLSVAWRSDAHDSMDGGGRIASGTAVEERPTRKWF